MGWLVTICSRDTIASRENDDNIERVALGFKHMWELAKLITLIDTMEHDRMKGLTQHVYEEGWTDAKAREKAFASGAATIEAN